jgi:predicted transcriptional regulator
MVPKSLQIDSLLNERLRRFAFDTRTKEAQIIRDALHAWLAAKGF